MLARVLAPTAASTHPSQPEIAENTSALAAHDTAVLNLCRTGVAVHLRQLELGLRADALRERGVADNVAQRLSVWPFVSHCMDATRELRWAPLRLVLRVDLALGVVANVADLGKAPDVELGRTELRHDGGGWAQLAVSIQKSSDWGRR